MSVDRRSGPPLDVRQGSAGSRLLRRAMIRAVGSAVLALPLGLCAQPSQRSARIGYLAIGSPTSNVGLRNAFLDGLREHGWIEGGNIAIEYRWSEVGNVPLDDLALELARLPFDAIFAVNTPTALAMKRTGTTLPIVFAAVSEPVEIGLVQSLQRAGSNFTGLTTINRELMSKRLELLKEAVPGVSRVGYLANPDYNGHQRQLDEMQATARRLALTLHFGSARSPGEFENAFLTMSSANVGALIVQQDDLFNNHRASVVALALQRRLPAMYVFSFYPAAGGLVSYGANVEDLCRRAAGYVDRILQGARPQDLPVERPAKFDLVVNLKTAQALGIPIPSALLLRATRTIE